MKTSATYISRIILGTIIFLLSFNSSSAQPYPVSASLYVIPPVGVSLPELQYSNTPKIMGSLILTDLNRPTYNVKLKITISGNGILLTTLSQLTLPPLTLLAGQPYLLNQNTLAPYLDVNSLDVQGISRTEFIRSGQRLPEGTYNICIEAFDYNRPGDLPVSNTACALTLIEMYDPPILFVPTFANTLLFENQPPAFQQGVFTWQPMHPINIPVKYNLRIYRGTPATQQLPVDGIIQNLAPYIDITTTNTFYNLTPLDPPISRTEEYYSVVQVIPDHYPAIFKNLGNSQIVTFSLLDMDAGKCAGPEGYRGKSLRLGIGLQWKIKQACDQYVSQYYDESNQILKYQQANIRLGEALADTIFHLESRKTYVLRTGCLCGQDTVYSDTVRIHFDRPKAKVPDFNCGLAADMGPPIEDMLPILKEGDTIIANDLKVIIRKSVGQNGIFSGKGHIEIPYFKYARANVTFNSIHVNDEYRMTYGDMSVVGVGQNVLSDDDLEDLLNLMESLQDISDFLGNLDEILAMLEELISQLEGTLPPWLIEELKRIQSEIANRPDQESLDALRDRMAKLNEIKNEWEIFILHIVIEGVKDLNEEYQTNRSRIVSDYNSKSQYFSGNNGMEGQNNDDESDIEFELPEHLGIVVNTMTWTEFAEINPEAAQKAQALIPAEDKYATLLILEKLDDELNIDNVMDLLCIMKSVSIDILKDIRVELEAHDWDMDKLKEDKELPGKVEEIIRTSIIKLYYNL